MWQFIKMILIFLLGNAIPVVQAQAFSKGVLDRVGNVLSFAEWIRKGSSNLRGISQDSTGKQTAEKKCKQIHEKISLLKFNVNFCQGVDREVVGQVMQALYNKVGYFAKINIVFPQ